MVRRLGALVSGLACVAALTACEGPEGPAGPLGATGPQGPAGAAGQDANENCTQCHVNDAFLFVKEVQYEQSTHRMGGNFERSETDCAICHTHQGFLERVTTNAYATAADISDPAPINCRTCHQIHTTYTSADFAFTATTPVPLYNFNYATGMETTVDYGADAGNLCARCHQARKLSPVPVLGGADVTITSSRYGVHHGPQAQVVAGTGAFEFTGTATIAGGPSSHGDPAANAKVCATCHMGEAFGEQAGGHTWKMAYEYHGSDVDNVAGCNESACHNGAVGDFNEMVAGVDVQDSVLTLLSVLDTLLVGKGVKMAYSPGYTLETIDAFAVAGTFPAALVAAFTNWQLFAEARDLGIHNPAYVMAVLQNTIEVVQALP